MVGLTENPFLGAGSYQYQDSDRFFGRNDDRNRLLAMVESNRVSVVYGYSGFGKTSLLQAGLAPSLEARGRAVCIMRPVEDPWSEMCDAILHRAFPEPALEARRLQEVGNDVFGEDWPGRKLSELKTNYSQSITANSKLRRHLRGLEDRKAFNRPCIMGLFLHRTGTLSTLSRYLDQIAPNLLTSGGSDVNQPPENARSRRMRAAMASKDAKLGDVCEVLHSSHAQARFEQFHSVARDGNPSEVFEDLYGLGDDPVIVVDQAEQLFTLFSDRDAKQADRRDQFLQSLARIAAEPPETAPGIGILLSLRQEYLASVVERGRTGLSAIWPATKPFSTYQGYQLGPLTNATALEVATEAFSMNIADLEELNADIDALVRDVTDADDCVEPAHFSLVFSELWRRALALVENSNGTRELGPDSFLAVFADLQATSVHQSRSRTMRRATTPGELLLEERIDKSLQGFEAGSVEEFEMFCVFAMLHNGSGTRIVRDRNDIENQAPHDPKRRHNAIEKMREARIVRVTNEREDQQLVDITHERLIPHLDRRRVQAFHRDDHLATADGIGRAMKFRKLEDALSSRGRTLRPDDPAGLRAIRTYVEHCVEDWRSPEGQLPDGWSEIARIMLTSEIASCERDLSERLLLWSDLACNLGRSDTAQQKSGKDLHQTLVRAIRVLKPDQFNLVLKMAMTEEPS